MRSRSFANLLGRPKIVVIEMNGTAVYKAALISGYLWLAHRYSRGVVRGCYVRFRHPGPSWFGGKSTKDRNLLPSARRRGGIVIDASGDDISAVFAGGCPAIVN